MNHACSYPLIPGLAAEKGSAVHIQGMAVLPTIDLCRLSDELFAAEQAANSCPHDPESPGAQQDQIVEWLDIAFDTCRTLLAGELAQMLPDAVTLRFSATGRAVVGDADGLRIPLDIGQEARLWSLAMPYWGDLGVIDVQAQIESWAAVPR